MNEFDQKNYFAYHHITVYWKELPDHWRENLKQLYPGETNSFNTLPAGWREISKREYYHKLSGTTPSMTKLGQMHYDQDGNRLDKVVEATLQFYPDGTGLAFQFQFWAGQHPDSIPESEMVKYYAFGCKHDWQELTVREARELGQMHYGNCYHVYRCKECKRFKGVDTSG